MEVEVKADEEDPVLVAMDGRDVVQFPADSRVDNDGSVADEDYYEGDDDDADESDAMEVEKKTKVKKVKKEGGA
jgi:hypothetical protein